MQTPPTLTNESPANLSEVIIRTTPQRFPTSLSQSSQLPPCQRRVLELQLPEGFEECIKSYYNKIEVDSEDCPCTCFQWRGSKLVECWTDQCFSPGCTCFKNLRVRRLPSVTESEVPRPELYATIGKLLIGKCCTHRDHVYVNVKHSSQP